MDLLVENQKGERTHFFGVQDFQVDDSGTVVVMWPVELETDETSVEGNIVAGGESADLETYYDMMIDALMEDWSVVVADLGQNTTEKKVYDEIVEGVENGVLSVDEEKLDNVTLVE